jgi:exopolyphosphatase/guanosine-5'-triphosphate,3'-diphosphate pyrophosphatase
VIIAAIDIGSNAARLQITKLINYEGAVTFKKLEYIRFPLRLGKDVFSVGKITATKKLEFFKLLRVFNGLIELYEIDHIYACATSAMREARNGQDIIQEIKNNIGLDVNILSGQEEAEMIDRVIALYLNDKVYLHIDVGGGSTELNLYVKNKKVRSKSFDIGTVRAKDLAEYMSNWKKCIDWIELYVRKPFRNVITIGTGGNINKLHELSGDSKKTPLSIDTLEKTRDMLAAMSLEDKLCKLLLNPDRADVIVPAADIYLQIMQTARSKTIAVPMVGLKDGINFMLYEMYFPNKGVVTVKNQNY